MGASAEMTFEQRAEVKDATRATAGQRRSLTKVMDPFNHCASRPVDRGLVPAVRRRVSHGTRQTPRG
jgi:hypothetical protein